MYPSTDTYRMNIGGEEQERKEKKGRRGMNGKGILGGRKVRREEYSIRYKI